MRRGLDPLHPKIKPTYVPTCIRSCIGRDIVDLHTKYLRQFDCYTHDVSDDVSFGLLQAFHVEPTVEFHFKILITPDSGVEIYERCKSTISLPIHDRMEMGT